MEGTRLTIVKVPQQPDAYEFSIRTPVTPPRWKDFEQVGIPPPSLCHVPSCLVSALLATFEEQAWRHAVGTICCHRNCIP